MKDASLNTNLIKELRDKSGLSQEKIAQKIGKVRSMIIYYESGKYKIPFKNKKLIKLFDQYGIEYKQFLKATRPTPKVVTQHELNKAVFLNMIDKVSDFERRQRIFDFIESMVVEEMKSNRNNFKDPDRIDP